MLTHKYRTILGDIPPDWVPRSLRDVVRAPESFSGDWGDDRGEVSMVVLRSTNFTNDGHMDLSDAATRWFPADLAQSLQLCSGDILLERSGGGPEQPVGRVLLIDRDMPGHAFGNFIHRLRPDTDKTNPSFLRWVLHELHRSGIVERLQHQTTQMRNLEFRDYMRVPLPFPPTIDEQQAIARTLDQCDGLIASFKSMLGIQGSLHRDDMKGPLNRLKMSLLQNLLTGKVRIK